MPHGPRQSKSTFKLLVSHGLTRAIILAVMLAVAVVQPLGGAALLSHGGADFDPHLHLVQAASELDRSADWHADDHWQADASIPAVAGHLAEQPSGTFISIPSFDHTLVRGIELSKPIKVTCADESPSMLWVVAAGALGNEQRWMGLSRSAPLHLCSLRSQQRILRTSNALLI